MAVRSGWRAFLGAVVLPVFAASCALPPPPQSGTPPPVTAPGAPANQPAPAPAPGAPLRLDREPTIDIGLAWDLDSLVITLGSEQASGSLGAVVVGPHESRRLFGPGRLRLGVEAGRIVRRGAPEERRQSVTDRLEPSDTLEVEGSGRGWNGKTWRGTLRVFVNPRGKLTLVTRLPIEQYLLGVIPGEIGALANDLIEAGRAQAIAARSYTFFYRGRRATEGFDLYGTVEDQVYGSIESERPLATRVVEGTRGVIALSAGQPIRANYSSTCGGVTSEVWEAWPAGPLPYLVSHRDAPAKGVDYCAASPQYRWREEWSPEEFVANVARYGPPQGVALPPDGVGDLIDVRAAARSRSGRVWRLVVTTTTGEVSIPAWSLRQVLRRGGNASAILRSNLFKIDVWRDPASRRALAVVASGAGSGHGVGLCQTGALGMARAGVTGEQIIRHYYSGVSLQKLYR